MLCKNLVSFLNQSFSALFETFENISYEKKLIVQVYHVNL